MLEVHVYDDTKDLFLGMAVITLDEQEEVYGLSLRIGLLPVSDARDQITLVFFLRANSCSFFCVNKRPSKNHSIAGCGS